MKKSLIKTSKVLLLALMVILFNSGLVYAKVAVILDETVYSVENIKTIKKVNEIFPGGFDQIRFSDMKGHWGEQVVNKFSRDGLVKGYPDGTIRPDDNITLAELIAIVIRAKDIKIDNSGENQSLKVELKPIWARAYIASATKYNIIEEKNSIGYNADCEVSRSDVVKILVRAMELDNSNNIEPVYYSQIENGSGRIKKVSINEYSDADEIVDNAKSYFSKALQKGIIVGYPDNTIQPEKYITRVEAIAMIDRMLSI